MKETARSGLTEGDREEGPAICRTDCVGICRGV
jgi:hypothetical protein